MIALVLAAGLGTRLRPLTDDRPKALVPHHGKPLLDHVVESLLRQGCDELVVNLHHHAPLMREHLESRRQRWGVPLHLSDESHALLDTGGAILHARQWLATRPDFLVHNVDILTDLDLRALEAQHLREGNLATLATRPSSGARQLLFDPEGQLRQWRDLSTGQVRWASPTQQPLLPLGFMGIHMLSSRLFDLLTEAGSFSIIDVYLRLAASERVRAHEAPRAQWRDMGTPAAFAP